MKIVKNMLDLFWKSKEMERSRCRSVIFSGWLGLSPPVPLSDEQKRGYGPGLPGAQLPSTVSFQNLSGVTCVDAV